MLNQLETLLTGIKRKSKWQQQKKQILHYGLELKHKLKLEWVVNILQGLCNWLLRFTRKQVEAIEVLNLERINYLNGLNKNGEQAAEKNQKAKDVTYLIKLGKVYLQKKKQQLIELKLVVQKKVSNLLNNLKLLLLKLKGSENENNK